MTTKDIRDKVGTEVCRISQSFNRSTGGHAIELENGKRIVFGDDSRTKNKTWKKMLNMGFSRYERQFSYESFMSM
jgi:hypothetical protein